MTAPTLFLSHASADKPFVSRLIVALRAAGVPDPWYDTLELDGATEDIPETLRRAVEASDWFGLVLSPAAVRSHWVTYEVQAAQAAAAKSLILMTDSPDGPLPYLANPHVAELLRGGRRKVLDFTADFERALTDLLLVVAREIGEERDTALTLRDALESEDIPVAERAMSHAALYPERFIPALFGRVPDLASDAKLRFRVGSALAAIGSPAVDPLMVLAFGAGDDAAMHLPEVPPIGVDKSGTRRYAGDSAAALMRAVMLSGGDRVWKTRKGAESCLVTLASSDPSLRRRIVDAIHEVLDYATRIILSDRFAATDHDFDILRVAIATLGRAAAPGDVDDLLVHQFVTTDLWGAGESYHAKLKLASYVVHCLSRSGSNRALDHLCVMLADDELIDMYFRSSRHPDPWARAFVRFGARAVDRLLELRASCDRHVLPMLHLNLAQIRHPRASGAALQWVSGADDPVATIALRSVARVGIRSACDELLELHADGAFEHLVTGVGGERVYEAVAIAARHAGSAPGLLDELLRHAEADAALRIELARTIPAIGAHALYGVVEGWLTDSNPHVRTAAAIALSAHKVLKRPDALLDELDYAGHDDQAPGLGVALSYFEHDAAVTPLVRGLKHSLLRDDDAAHELYAEALLRIGSDTARQAHAVWYRRV